MDANGNGFVEFDELVAAISPTLFTDDAVLVNQQHLLEVFRFFDHNRNSYIILAELAGSMAKMGQPLTYRELIEMIKEADTGRDGVISFHEFVTIMAKFADNFGFPLS
ncbi:Calcium-binding protein [Actinidia chinensis var. chinensis]|uniref:Calcium-binding protein n=1 Tax=Actinidia chinensis var. chinensis TaxID=1590841 RepID=A0A2R6QI61_ACTCC|nr:Calcium-binding protein [Actinidia chinensis var. chinensis]